MEKKKENIVVTQDGFNHGPVAKREDRLSSYLRWSIIANIILILLASAISLAAALKPDRVVVVEKNTGRILGEYRTTAFRTNDELVAATQKFAENFLSLNSRSIYDDYAVALNMMSYELREKRKDYLKRTNLLRKIELSNTRSMLDIKERRVLNVKGIYAKTELSGDIVIDQTRNINLGRKNKVVKEDVKLSRSAIQFRLVIDLRMVPVTETNTVGAEVVDFYEYD